MDKNHSLENNNLIKSNQESQNLLNDDMLHSMLETLESEKKIDIEQLAFLLWKQKEDLTLPNWKTVQTINWNPSELSSVFFAVAKLAKTSWLSDKDLVNINGAGPAWLVATISHALHPSYPTISYPQGGPDAKLPLSGATVEWEWKADELKFSVSENDEYTLVEFTITAEGGNLWNVLETVQSLSAPEVSLWKPVYITGRWPIAIAVNLAEAYAHKVPFVALFQPWTGYVSAISHGNTKLWTTF